MRKRTTRNILADCKGEIILSSECAMDTQGPVVLRVKSILGDFEFILRRKSACFEFDCS
jgi:hypothetical protein